MTDLWTCPGPVTVAELAAACRCSTRFIQKAIGTGTLEAVALGRVLRIRASDARRFALEVGVEPPAPENVAHHAHDANSANLAGRTVATGVRAAHIRSV
jgi:excisionase family DNA binding protein